MLTERFLDVTRIEAGQLRLTVEKTDARALIEGIGERYRTRCEDAGVSLTVVKSSLPLVLNVDAARLETVLSNVLSNAVKYTPSGGKLELRAESDERTGKVRIIVTDTGRGIPQELRRRVFDKFFRVEHARPTSSRKPRGAGLGLYLCKQIVDAHGGTIQIADAGPAGGTRVEIDLPAEVV